MKCQQIRFGRLVHFGKGQQLDFCQLGDPRNRWIAEIEVDIPNRMAKVTTKMDGLHPFVMIPLENVTSWIPAPPPAVLAKPPEAKGNQPLK